jgi:pimeloyl-ACP methyl ester carboxylesterase
MGYTITSPADIPDAPTVILAHGFQGNRGSMVDWATHYASWGLVVVTPDLCHATIIDADHAQNGADLVALAAHLELAAPIYAGYSAGGLAAVLAAAQDPNALALVGLDMVDSDGLGAAVAASIGVPAHDVTAEPAMCNSTANGVPVFAAIPEAQTLRIVEADHCDFQSPPDAFCGLCSAPNDAQDPADIAATIRGLTTAALLWRSGVDASGEEWWTPGNAWFDMLVGDGSVQDL